MSPAKRDNHFNPIWVQKYSWVEKHPTSSMYACCTLCKSDIHLGSMGVSALESHRKGKKHIFRIPSSSPSIRNWFSSSSTSSTTATSSTLTPTASPSAIIIPTSQSAEATSDPITFAPTAANVDTFVIKEDALKAEILWAMHNAVTHHSFNSSKHANELFRHMFPDSKIAEKFMCGSTKLAYFLSFGLSPYFLDELSDELKDTSHIVVLFDESFNHITRNEQMDVHVRYWSDKQQLTVTRYLTSKFMGHCTSNDLLHSLNEAINILDTCKVLQISMDGPHVNHKFYSEYTVDRKMMHPEAPDLIDIGSCGLHVVHGAFKRGVNATGWKMEDILRSLWYVFADSPARRADYTALTGSSNFPLQFCATRWIEDVVVAVRAVDIWADVCKYVTAVSSGPKSKIPKSFSYITISKAVNDPLVLAKLHVFVATAKCLSPFLQMFQADKPMAPFLAKELYKMLILLMEKFIKRTVVEFLTVSSILKLNLNEEGNTKSSKHVSVGFAASEILKHGEFSEAKSVEFRYQCKCFYKAVCEKILERSPLNFPVVQHLDCLNPKTMVNSSQTRQEHMFEDLLSSMTANKLVNNAECDEILQQHKSLLAYIRNEQKEDFQMYDMKSQRLDVFLGNHMSRNPQFAKLWNIVKMLLILSHGQASIERGFSVSKDCLKNNMSEKTLVALRVVNDALANELGSVNIGQVYKIPITKKMLTNCRAARLRYRHFLEDVERNEAVSKEAKQKKRILENISDCKLKKQKLETNVGKLLAEADILYTKAEEESDLTLLSSANSLKNEIKVIETDAKKQVQYIKQYEEKLKKLQ